MKSKFWLFFLIVFLPVALLFGRDMSEQQFGDGPVGRRGQACVAVWDTTQNSGVGNNFIGDQDGDGYVGHGDAGANLLLFPQAYKVCRFDAILNKEAGTIVGQTLYAEIWDFGASNPASTSLPGGTVTNGLSNGVAGDDTWSHTRVSFIFPTNVTVVASSATHKQKITLSTHSSGDGSNYASWDKTASSGQNSNRGRIDTYNYSDTSHVNSVAAQGFKCALYIYQ
jgi:hypothetical protein